MTGGCRSLRAFALVGTIVSSVGSSLLSGPLQVGASPAGSGPIAQSSRIVPKGDTLTVIQRPLLNIPSLVAPGDTLVIECQAGSSTSGWDAWLNRSTLQVPLAILSASYDPSTLWWSLRAVIPSVDLYELYDLVVTANGGIADTTWQAVRVIPQFKDDYYFIHITDTHLPTDLYYYEEGSDTDTSEMQDLRAVIDDINIINPEFVLLTGDAIHEGELEDYLNRRYYTRTQKLLTEFQVPVFLTSGNHDIGGWDDTPPADGTARRDWWRFFGWKRLNSPPPGAPWRTQDYSFDYGPVHYVGMEAYINYDNWRWTIYGDESFTAQQMDWLADDLAAASGSAAQVLFYHYDFSDQINLSSLGVEMALWGHIHANQGSISSPPYDLGTNNVCNGERSYRLIRVSDDYLSPTATISAGSSGQNLRVQYSPANDGTHQQVSAAITNNLGQRFEHALLRFLMPGPDVSVTGGTLLQVDDSGPVAVCYVAVDILSNSTKTVTVTITVAPPPVTDLLAQLAVEDIVLSWSPPEGSIARYVIYRNTQFDFIPASGDSIGTTVDTTYVDPGAAGSVGINYFYAVKAVSISGQKSEPSETAGEFDMPLMNGTLK